MLSLLWADHPNACITNAWKICQIFQKITRSVATMCYRMFHNFTFFEIKNAWGLMRWDFGRNQRKKIFFDRTLFQFLVAEKFV